MIKILFVCLGNICRSPMAEFVMKDLVKKEGLEDYFLIESAATSAYESGNPVHYGTREILKRMNISCAGKTSRQMRYEDYKRYDYLIGMEQRNLVNMKRITKGDPDNKMFRLLDYSDCPRDIADPWYTDNFEITYEDILEGCSLLMNKLKEKL